MNKLQDLVSEETALWLSGAPFDEVAMILNMGYASYKQMNVQPVVKPPMEPKVIKSQHAGRIGEDYVEAFLQKKFKIIRTAGISKSGDLTLFIEHNKIMVEVKNYQKAVPSAEVKKFQRDIFTSHPAGAIFISLQSDITGIDNTFSIKYEATTGTIVPCIYIVSNDEQLIISSIGIITELITAGKYISAQLQNEDTMINSVYNISSALDMVSKTRDDLQCVIGDINKQLSRTTSNIVIAEKNMRDEIKIIKGELFHETLDYNNCIEKLMMNDLFIKYNDVIKAHIIEIIECINENAITNDLCKSAGINSWKLTDKQYTNVITGISFKFFVAKVDVIIPREKINTEIMIKLIELQISTTCNQVCILLSPQSVGVILNIIKG